MGLLLSQWQALQGEVKCWPIPWLVLGCDEQLPGWQGMLVPAGGEQEQKVTCHRGVSSRHM